MVRGKDFKEQIQEKEKSWILQFSQEKRIIDIENYKFKEGNYPKFTLKMNFNLYNIYYG